jgi:ribosomal protein L37AE/L43A
MMDDEPPLMDCEFCGYPDVRQNSSGMWICDSDECQKILNEILEASSKRYDRTNWFI